jgi:hypothetical protein
MNSLGRWQDDLAVCWRYYPLGSFSWRQYLLQVSALPRETIEWWPLLTVESEVNGDSKSTTERGSS